MIAGGRSQRMGVDKARVPFPERWPMAVHVLQVLERSGLTTHLVRRGASDGLPWLRPHGGAVSVIYEADGDPHPLRGVATALQHCDEAAFVVPCDVPWLDEAAVRLMLAQGGPCVAWDGERVHPLCAIYLKERLDEARAAVAAEASARSFAAVERRVLLPARWLRNLNRWADGGAEDPLETLARRLAFLNPRERARALDGERGRLRQRGVLCVGGSGRGAPPGDP